MSEKPPYDPGREEWISPIPQNTPPPTLDDLPPLRGSAGEQAATEDLTGIDRAIGDLPEEQPSVPADQPDADKSSTSWLIPGAIVTAGIIVAIAVVLATRSPDTPEAPVPVQVVPVPVSIAPPPVVIPTAVSTASDPAQLSLESTLNAALQIRAEQGSFEGATSFDLATHLPEISFLPPTSASTAPSVVSVSATAPMFSAAALSDTGVCYWIKNNGTTTWYGSGAGCTGIDAVAAIETTWPSPSPSPSPSASPSSSVSPSPASPSSQPSV